MFEFGREMEKVNQRLIKAQINERRKKGDVSDDSGIDAEFFRT